MMTDHVAMRTPVGGNQSHRGRDADSDRQLKAQPSDGRRWNQRGRLGCFNWRMALKLAALRTLMEDGQLAVGVSVPMHRSHSKDESDIGAIGCLLSVTVVGLGRIPNRGFDEGPEDLPRRNRKGVITEAIPADAHQPALPATRIRKYARKTSAARASRW
jgi:hypothetical protein